MAPVEAWPPLSCLVSALVWSSRHPEMQTASPPPVPLKTRCAGLQGFWFQVVWFCSGTHS